MARSAELNAAPFIHTCMCARFARVHTCVWPDLVLEGLALPPHITHNVHVLLPDRRDVGFVISLWETTRNLMQKHFPECTDARDVLNMRTDLAVLLIMNGNDYIPKLRFATFDSLFSQYKQTVKKYLKDEDRKSCFLIDPATLEFNVDFCADYFSALAKGCYKDPMNAQSFGLNVDTYEKTSSVNILNVMLAQKLLPRRQNKDGFLSPLYSIREVMDEHGERHSHLVNKGGAQNDRRETRCLRACCSERSARSRAVSRSR